VSLHDPDARYRRLGPLTGNEACIQHPEMDGQPVTVIANLWQVNGPQGVQGPPVAVVVLPGVCRPQFSMLPSEFRCYLSKPHPEWPSHLYGWYEEGVTWIRGHHAPDSKEVAALLVAHALGATQ
jgi:hypothetical protein